MSLRVWLPLTKDLSNNGLSDVTITNNGATLNSAGKLGGCYSFVPGSSNNITNAFSTNVTSPIGSLACWVKFNSFPSSISSSSGWYCLMHVGRSGGFTACRLGMYMEYTNKINISINGTGTGINTYTHSLVTNQWYHLCTTYNGTTLKLYIDGTEVYTKNTSGGTYTTDATSLFVGGTSGYYLNGYLSDVRYYDHALSLKEVKELSKGLMCHYQLNGYGSQENLFSWQNKGNQVINLNAYQNVGSFGQLSNCLTFDPSTTVGTKYTISFWARSPNGSTSLRLYNSNGSPRWFYFNTTLSSSLGAEWQYFTYTFTNADRGSGTETTSIVRRIEIYMPSQTGGQVKNIKIEVGDVATGWSPGSTDSMYSKLGYDSTTVYDSSGYNYHCTLSGTLSNNVDTPRNTISTYFNGTAQITRESITSEVKSVSFWIKANKTATTVAFSDARSKIAFGFNGGKQILTGCSGRSVYFHYATTFTDNVWHHVAIIKTSSTDTDDVYIDGEFAELGTVKDHFTHQTDIFCMTGRSYSAPCKMSCYISDFRLYATALSAEDIKALYEAPVSISDHGEMFTQGEFIEV